MNRWASNSGLLFISFLMAVGIVWIKGQDRLGTRPMSGIPVSIENLPTNMVLPDPWSPPTVSVTLQGPKSALDLIRAVQCGFFIHFSRQALPEEGTPQNVVLTESMFRTSLMDDKDQMLISVDEDKIRPRQVAIHLLPWDVTGERPSYDDLAGPDSLIVPIYRIQKKVPIVAPTVGEPPNGLILKEIAIDPPEILITGPKEAVDRVRSVSTAIMDLSFLSAQLPPQYMALPDLEEDYAVWPVAKNIRGVTVTLKLSK